MTRTFIQHYLTQANVPCCFQRISLGLFTKGLPGVYQENFALSELYQALLQAVTQLSGFGELYFELECKEITGKRNTFSSFSQTYGAIWNPSEGPLAVPLKARTQFITLLLKLEKGNGSQIKNSVKKQ